jgi:hypothetical protein
MGFRWPAGLDISNVPLRKVVTRACAHTNGTSRTHKHPDHEVTFIPGDSPNELLFIRFAEVDPNVIAIAAQPTRVVGRDASGTFSHIPDFALVVRGEGEIVEVKSDKSYAQTETRERLTAAAEYVDSTGWTYFVALRSDLFEHPLVDRVQDLWRECRRPYSALQRLAVRDLLHKNPMCIADVRRRLEPRLGSKTPSFEVVLSLAARGEVFIDLSAPIGEHSTIRYPDEQAMPPILLPRRRPGSDPYPTEAA